MKKRRTADEVARLLRDVRPRPGQGTDCLGRLPQDRHRRDHLLPLATATRPRPGRCRPPVPRTRGRGRATQAARGRADARQADAPGHRQKKVVTPDQQRAAADYLGERYGVSQRRISRRDGAIALDLEISPYAPGTDEPALTREIKRLARRHPRYGYRRIHAMLVRRGWTVNLKRVRRLWIELGLKRPVRLRKPRKLGPKPGTSANSCVATTGPVQERRLDLRLHPRPDGGRSPAQVADAGGRIYSGVPGAARGRVDDGGRCPADRGPGDRASRGTDSDQER